MGVLRQDAGCTAGLSPALPKSQALAPSRCIVDIQVEEVRETVLYEGVSVGGSEEVRGQEAPGASAPKTGSGQMRGGRWFCV